MYMRKILILLVLSFSLAGCKSGFKSGFKNFNAYYNTYYNAKKNYEVGLDKSLTQKRRYNTLQPIRIYEEPLGAGAPEFQNAIEKGADVLRKYKETKWVDNALEIIGKSYYFRKEYFSAIQKFDELYISSSDEKLKQNSVYWKGLVLLELQAYNEGIQFLEEQLSIFSGEWHGSLEHQVRVVLAEHYIARENWVNALDLLNESVAKIPGRANKERGFFLIGQINEILGDPEAAFSAYDRVEKYYTVYELQFEAKKKKAEVARSIGNSDEAYKVFAGMVRDDKNIDFISELNYELGRTEQDRGNVENAREIYISILQDPFIKPKPLTTKQVYNGLAELYRFNFNDFTMAAAYYDSSAKVNVPLDQLPETYNAQELAQSFGEYASLKTQIFEQDSLLWLGSLPQAEFDSVLAEIEASMIEQMKRQMEAEKERRNTMVNVGNGNRNNQPQTDVARNGFLNVRNPVMVAQVKEQFAALWNGRPLVDNWRVAVLMQNEILEAERVAEGENGESGDKVQEFYIDIDLSRIPFTPQAKDSVKEDQAFMYYELGNLFFLSLDLPDSARIYFQKVLDERPESEVAPVTMYSLSELYDIQKNKDQAVRFAQMLIEQYPATEYADRLVEKYDLERPELDAQEELSPLQSYLAINANSEWLLPEKADTLARLSKQHPKEKFSDNAMYESIQAYIKEASNQSGFKDTLSTWFQIHDEWENSRTDFSELQDSIRLVYQDTTLAISSEDSLYYTTVLDSTLTQPDFRDYFPYYGTYWDSTRARVNDFTKMFASSEFTPVVKRWKLEFEKPIIEEPDTVTIDTAQLEEDILDAETDYLSCMDLNQTPEIRGGIEQINQELRLPNQVEEETINFFFFINQRGIIDEYKLASDTRNEELINAYVDVIDSFVTFEPMMVNGIAQMVSCEIQFTIPK